jgi:hypothetical protein
MQRDWKWLLLSRPEKDNNLLLILNTTCDHDFYKRRKNMEYENAWAPWYGQEYRAGAF